VESVLKLLEQFLELVRERMARRRWERSHRQSKPRRW